MRRKGLAFLFLVLAAMAGALPLSAPFPRQAADYLPAGAGGIGGPAGLSYKDGKIVSVEGNAGEVSLAPVEPLALELAGRLTGGGKADRMRFEAVGVLARPGAYLDGSARPAEAEELARIAGILGSVSAMQGLEYWSASRDTWRTLYAESWRVDAPASQVRLPDLAAPRPGEVPAAWSWYARQRDLTFGANVYRFDAVSSPRGFAMTSSNETPLKMLFLNAVAPGDLQAALVILPARDGILVYVLTTMKAVPLLREKAFDSVGNRAFALYWWFAKQAEATGLAVAPAERPIAAR